MSGQKLPVLVDDWGVWGHGDGQFANIGDVAVDASANVYVADRFNNRIQKFDSDGKFIAKWGSWGSGDGQFIFPPGLAVTASGNVYVADQFNNRVQKFDSNGNFITKWGSEGTGNGQFSAPQDVAVDGSGNVFVADSGNNRIQKFDNSGQFLLKWGTEGSANKQFSVPTGVEVDHLGNVYVADFFNHRIQKFDGSGQYLDQWGTPGHGGGQFVFPHGVAVDGNGNVYVTDQSNHRIQKFDGSGTLLMKWGCEGSSDCQFDYPTGIAVDKWGYVYVADFGNSRIQKFGPEPVEFMYLQPLKEYSDNGTDRVYRRGLKNFFNVQMIIPQGYTNPQLQITDAGKPEGTTNVKIIGPKVLGNVAQFRLDVPDNNPVGTYRIRGILTSGAKKLKTCELPVYVIFDVPKSMVADKASVKAYLYDEAGHRDEKSYQFSWHYGSTNKGGGKWWARDWPESGYVLNPFDKGLFAMVIRAVNGQTMESQVAEDLMWAISNVIMYVGTNPCKNVAKMLGGAVDADLFAKAYGPQGEETQFIQGQCLDYAHGLSAVLRSIGIPTRVATKIESSGFSYHEWTETFLENPPSGTDKWYYYDAMDYTHSPSADLTKPPVGSFARMTSPFSSSAFEILVGDTSWKIDGAVQITETAMLPNKRVGVQRLGTNANDALFEKCEKKHYNPSDCPDIDPPALGLVTITLDQDRYRIRDPITATVHVTNPEPQEQSFDLSFRFYVVDAEDDGRDAFGDPVLDMPGSGISGETLFEERELLTVPAGSSAERVYEFQVEDMDLPSDQHWAEAVASGDLGTDVHAVDIPVDPGYDQVIAYDPRDPALGDELVLTLTLTNRLTFPLTELSVNFEMPEFFSTSDMLHAEVGDLEPGEEIAFDWVFAPVGENIPTLQHFRLIVNTENGGNLVEPLEVELRRPPMPRILPISVPPTVLVGEVFQISYEIENIGDGPLYDARVALSLPEGVAALEEALPQSIGDVPPGENAVVTWALVSEIVGVQLFVITVEDEAGVVLSERPDLVEIIMEEPDLPLDSPAGGEGYIGIWEVIDNGEINDQGACYASLNSGEGSIASHWKSVLNLWDSGGNGHFGSDDGFAVVDIGYREQGSVDDLSLIARGTIRIPAGQGGFWTFGVNSDDGLTLQLPGQNFISVVNGEIMHFESGAALRFYGDRGAADTLGLIELLPGNYPFWLT
ncbi:MAG: 6-bladed beta-propeller, partial [Phycisphaerales bacterium]